MEVTVTVLSLGLKTPCKFLFISLEPCQQAQASLIGADGSHGSETSAQLSLLGSRDVGESSPG